MESLQVRIRLRSILVVSIIGISLFASAALAEEPYPVAWSRQLGTSAYDAAWSVTVDAFGNVYISGDTYGNLGGPNMTIWLGKL